VVKPPAGGEAKALFYKIWDATGDRDQLVAEIAAWEQQRNAAGARVEWMFTTDRARNKLARAYPRPTKES
jgi:hypothetical protein